MSRDWIQLRLRVPPELHKELEDDALAHGSTIQRELMVRIKRGSGEVLEGTTATLAHASVRGELEVAEKMVASLSALIAQMKAQSQFVEPESDSVEG